MHALHHNLCHHHLFANMVEVHRDTVKRLKSFNLSNNSILILLPSKLTNREMRQEEIKYLARGQEKSCLGTHHVPLFLKYLLPEPPLTVPQHCFLWSALNARSNLVHPFLSGTTTELSFTCCNHRKLPATSWTGRHTDLQNVVVLHTTVTTGKLISLRGREAAGKMKASCQKC